MIWLITIIAIIVVAVILIRYELWLMGLEADYDAIDPIELNAELEEARDVADQYKVRKDCFHAHKRYDSDKKLFLRCHACGGRIDPAIEPWDADHVIPKEMGGADDPSNVKPIHRYCHRQKTNSDVGTIAKSRRVSDKHYGIREKTGFKRPEGMKYNWKVGRYERLASEGVED